VTRADPDAPPLQIAVAQRKIHRVRHGGCHRGLTAAVLLAVFAVPCGTAQAGSVRGTVQAAAVAPRGIVVWIEGPTAPVPSETAVLSQQNMAFSPRLLVVVAGQTVAMPNEDSLAHNVFSMSPARPFNLGIYEKGEVKKVSFPEPGLVDVRCSIHRHMSAKVLVVPSAYFVQTDAAVPFEIPAVPEGTYAVKAWREGLAEPSSLQVTVPRDGAATADFSLAAPAPR
jgi:plastocyanin